MVRVGVIDSGGPADDPPGERAMARAFLADGAVHPAEPDRLGHGTAVAAIIRRAAPGAAILHAQVFGDRPLTSALRVAAALRPVYTAPTVEAAETALLEFAASDLGRKYPATVATWENAWERFIPFLEFPPEVRRIIYTTNAIESLNYQLRKIIKNRGHFPNDESVVKLLWLAIRDIEDKRARARAKEAGKPKGEPRTAPGYLVEGATTQGWKAALGALLIAFPDRLDNHIN